MYLLDRGAKSGLLTLLGLLEERTANCIDDREDPDSSIASSIRFDVSRMEPKTVEE
jgi:hypothetical protein